MTAQEAIVERWLARTMQAYPGETLGFLTRERDPFRNPVGYGVRRGLTALVEELLGEMDQGRVTDALDEIVRIRAVQDLRASQAVAFVFELRPILREMGAHVSRAKTERDERGAPSEKDLEQRIDRLALMAFEQYTRCREQLAEIRLKESRRALERPTAFPQSQRAQTQGASGALTSEDIGP